MALFSATIIIIIIDFVNFTPVLVGRLSLVPKWQQVSSSLQYSCEYSDLAQQCCDLNGLDSSSEFLFSSYSVDLGVGLLNTLTGSLLSGNTNECPRYDTK